MKATQHVRQTPSLQSALPFYCTFKCHMVVSLLILGDCQPAQLQQHSVATQSKLSGTSIFHDVI